MKQYRSVSKWFKRRFSAANVVNPGIGLRLEIWFQIPHQIIGKKTAIEISLCMFGFSEAVQDLYILGPDKEPFGLGPFYSVQERFFILSINSGAAVMLQDPERIHRLSLNPGGDPKTVVICLIRLYTARKSYKNCRPTVPRARIFSD